MSFRKPKQNATSEEKFFKVLEQSLMIIRTTIARESERGRKYSVSPDRLAFYENYIRNRPATEKLEILQGVIEKSNKHWDDIVSKDDVKLIAMLRESAEHATTAKDLIRAFVEILDDKEVFDEKLREKTYLFLFAMNRIMCSYILERRKTDENYYQDIDVEKYLKDDEDS